MIFETTVKKLGQQVGECRRAWDLPVIGGGNRKKTKNLYTRTGGMGEINTDVKVGKRGRNAYGKRGKQR